MKKAKTTLILTIIVIAIILFIVIFKTSNPSITGKAISENEETQPQTQQKKINFFPRDFKPTWLSSRNYRCDYGRKLKIVANPYDSLKHVNLPYKAYFDCVFKVGDYTKKIPIINNAAVVGEFDSSKSYRVQFCCKARDSNGNPISEEYCRTDYVQTLCS